MPDQTSGLLSKFLRKRRISAAHPFLHSPILDIGCGTGHLANFFLADQYVGIDIDQESLAKARELHSSHTFHSTMEALGNRKFKCIVALAVIEHVPEPEKFLTGLDQYLLPEGTFVLTTPHPAYEHLYHWGSQIGLFSRHAEEEHQDEYDLAALRRITRNAQLKIFHYQKFLLGANQLVILKKESSA